MTRLVCPFPQVSSNKRMLPPGKLRTMPSLAVTSYSPCTVQSIWRLGLGCESSPSQSAVWAEYLYLSSAITTTFHSCWIVKLTLLALHFLSPKGIVRNRWSKMVIDRGISKQASKVNRYQCFVPFQFYLKTFDITPVSIIFE